MSGNQIEVFAVLVLVEIAKYIKLLIRRTIQSMGLTKRGRNYYSARRAIEGLDTSLRKSICQYLYICGNISDFIDSYMQKKLSVEKMIDKNIPCDELILLCTVKDDLMRVQAQIEHHRKIGVRHFAYIDNMSTDGTFEWLKEQEDVILFSINEAFSASRSAAWKKQALDNLGYDRWYLVIDSDELFVYPGMELFSIGRYIEHLEIKGIQSILAPMIDMYSSKPVFSADAEVDFRNEYRFFDTDTYAAFTGYGSSARVRGGARSRLFGSINQVNLAKYPLTKIHADTIISCHNNFPINRRTRKIRYNKAVAFLLHYKFLPGDIQKFRNAIKLENYAGKSRWIKQYMKACELNPEISFYFESSQIFNSSMDLLKINICDKGFFEELRNSLIEDI